jgi:hypothetical protein
MINEDLSNVLKQMIVDDLGERVRILIDRGSKELEDRKNMSDNARDTQFQNFAELLWDELEQAMRQDFRGYIPEGETKRAKHIPVWQGIIARRAYDLVSHSLGYSLEYLDECGKEISGGMGKRIMPSIPDMTELPKESS